MCSIAFVILHYIAWEETISAVSHIKENCDVQDYKIIIVDNASPNDSFAVLTKEYREDPQVILVRNEENLGFARGNNVGYRIAKEKLKPRYIMLLNNDVYLLDKSLFAKLEEEYRKSGFALAGPANINARGEYGMSEWVRTFPTIESCRFHIKDLRKRIFRGSFGLYKRVYPFLRKIYNRLHIFQNPAAPSAGIEAKSLDSSAVPGKYYDIIIHGCCMIFSEVFINRFDGMDERTFLYGEERILFVQILARQMHTVFMPEIRVEHVGEVSTNTARKNESDERRTRNFFHHERISNEITLENLLRFKEENGMELYEWWSCFGQQEIRKRLGSFQRAGE